MARLLEQVYLCETCEVSYKVNFPSRYTSARLLAHVTVSIARLVEQVLCEALVEQVTFTKMSSDELLRARNEILMRPLGLRSREYLLRGLLHKCTFMLEEFVKPNLCIFMKLANLVNSMNKLTMQVTLLRLRTCCGGARLLSKYSIYEILCTTKVNGAGQVSNHLQG